jgi:energy-converting hydrogenase Eha subunit H
MLLFIIFTNMCHYSFQRENYIVSHAYHNYRIVMKIVTCPLFKTKTEILKCKTIIVNISLPKYFKKLKTVFETLIMHPRS